MPFLAAFLFFQTFSTIFQKVVLSSFLFSMLRHFDVTIEWMVDADANGSKLDDGTCFFYRIDVHHTVL